jgi:uncharacterized protein with PIN domain
VREYRFIIDHNVGKLARWLRMMGYDSVFFNGSNDSDMVKQALSEGRIVLTRDTAIMKRRVVTNGQLSVVLIESEEPEKQIRQVMDVLGLDQRFQPFTRCLECNQQLIERTPEEVRERVPPYVYKTQRQYMECPTCQRVYWRGTHWEAMVRRLERLTRSCS